MGWDGMGWDGARGRNRAALAFVASVVLVKERRIPTLVQDQIRYLYDLVAFAVDRRSCRDESYHTYV